ncbi:MAG: tetratricopeptide repeat protein [Woeseiaceae bacterium]
MSLISELRRRNVFRVGAAYIVSSWLIVQVAETIFPLFGFGTAPARVVVVVLTIGLIPALVLAWAFELTPEGLKRDDEAKRVRSVLPDSGQKWDRAISVILAVAVTFFALDKFLLEPTRDSRRESKIVRQAQEDALRSAYAEASIVVMPFASPGSDPEYAYLPDSFSIELIDALAANRALRVISETSAFYVREQNVATDEIGQQLNVGYLLGGSLSLDDDQIRIKTELIEIDGGTQLWSETFDGSLEDLSSVRDEIVNEVAGKLNVASRDDNETKDAVHPDAYRLFLQARYLSNQFTPASIAQAAALYDDAIEIDPNFSNAWSGLGWVYANQVSSGQRTADEALDLAREANWTALAIDPANARAFANIGWIAMSIDGNLAQAASHYSRALALDDSDPGIVSGSAVLSEALGRTEQAIALYKFSSARDPVNATLHSNLAAAYLSAGQLDEAIESIQTSIALSPTLLGSNYLLGLALLLKGDALAALESFEQEVDEEWHVKGRALALHDLDRAVEFEQAFNQLQSDWGEEWPSEIAAVFAWIGDTDAAFQWLDKALEAEESGLFDLRLSALFQKLHDDARWPAFLQKTGGVASQLERIEFDVNLPGAQTQTGPGNNLPARE